MPETIERKLAQIYTSEAIKCLLEICTLGTDEKARVAAAVAILDRGWGKPKQIISARIDADDIGDEDIEAEAHRILTSMGATIVGSDAAD